MSYDEHLISMAGGDGEPDLDAIQARADAATEGPWFQHQDWIDMGVPDASHTISNDPKPYGKFIASVGLNYDVKYGNADFIAHARTDVPALLAVVRSQQAKIERVKAVHEPKSWTKYGIPCFDEFDSPTARINGCTCGNENYPCPTIAALTATEGA